MDKYPRHIIAKLLLRRDVNRAKKIVAAVEREQLTAAYVEVINRKMKRTRINPRQVERMNDARKRARRVRRPPIPAPRVESGKRPTLTRAEIHGRIYDELETEAECGLLDPSFDEQGAPF
jgi:hypothetical protein